MRYKVIYIRTTETLVAVVFNFPGSPAYFESWESV